MTPFENLYVQFSSNDGGHATIRKWSQFPFAGGVEYALAVADTPAPSSQRLVLDGVKSAHPDIDALRRLVVEIRARSPALFEASRLLPFLEYLLSLFVGEADHGASLHSQAGAHIIPQSTAPTCSVADDGTSILPIAAESKPAPKTKMRGSE